MTIESYLNIRSKLFILILLIAMASNSYTMSSDSTKVNSKCSIGLNFNSLIHLPYLSFDYRINRKLAISLEAKPRIIPYQRSSGYSSESFYSRKVWENYNLGGFQGGLILHWLTNDSKQWHFYSAIEYTYFYKYGRYFYIYTTDDHDGVNSARHSSNNYYEFFSRSTHSLNALVFYGKEKIKIYFGFGISYNTERERGYTSWGVTTYEGYEGFISPLAKKSSYYSPVLKLGLKFSIFSFPNNKIKK